MFSPAFFAQLIGAVLGMALFGALVAWVIRRLFKVELKTSYAVGLLVMVFVAPAVYVLNSEGQRDFLDALFLYAIGGAIAYPVLVATSRRKT